MFLGPIYGAEGSTGTRTSTDTENVDKAEESSHSKGYRDPTRSSEQVKAPSYGWMVVKLLLWMGLIVGMLIMLLSGDALLVISNERDAARQ